MGTPRPKSVVFLLLLLLWAGAPLGCSADCGSTLTVVYAPGLIALDGQANDWDAVKPRYSFNLPMQSSGTGASASSVTASVRAAHDGTNLILLVQVCESG